MLTAAQFDSLLVPITDLYEQYNQSVINDIARRLASLDMTSSAAWQMQRLIESGKTYESAISELSKITGKSEAVLKEMFAKAGVKSLAFDDRIYKAAGLNPLPLNLSPAMQNVLISGLQKTGGIVRNLTMTTASSAQQAFLNAADLAYLQVSSGSMSYDQAIRAAIKDVAKNGLNTIQYASGHVDQLDVAMRRTVLTGVTQTTGKLQTTRADELDVDLIAVSAHIGARNTGTGPANHASWQGKVYSRTGSTKKYPNFAEVTGYGTGAGLCGWNCRHSFYPFYPGISENAYSKADLNNMAKKQIEYNGKKISIYDATQVQRAIERKIRDYKRQVSALEAGNQDATAEGLKVKQYQSVMRDFIKQMNTQKDFTWYRQREREQI
jgi:hypothetical protein